VHVTVHIEKDRPTVSYMGVIQQESRTKYYGCWIDWFGKRTYVKKGCVYVFRKAQVQHAPGLGVGLIVGKPWVAFRMNALGELLSYNWSSSVV
jgi:hypothetical protein